MAKSKRFLSHAEKDSRLKVKGPKTAARKQANVNINREREHANVEFVKANGITLLLTKQTVVTKDKDGHRVTKVVEKLEKPSQAIRRYYREFGKHRGQTIVPDPQQFNHPGRSTKATRDAKAKREAAKAKDALTEFLTTIS